MHRRAGSAAIVITLLLGGAAAESAASPLTVAYVDTVTGLEWAQLTGTTGFYWWEVDAVCGNDGSTACAADLGAVQVAGWTWARTSQVMALMANATDLAIDQLSHYRVEEWYGTVHVPQTVYATDSTWAPQFLSSFTPIVETETYRSVSGWAADGAYHDPRSAFLPVVRDAGPGGEDAAGRGYLVDSGEPHSPRGTDSGIWLFRPAEQVPVPEPSSLLLISLGVLGAWRAAARRNRATAFDAARPHSAR